MKIVQCAIGSIGYKQNLFAEGYCQWYSEQGNPTFPDYLVECLNDGIASSRSTFREAVIERIQQYSIEILDFDKIEGFEPVWYSERDEALERIKIERQSNSTYRSDSQCEAEAEVLIAHEKKGYLFLSQSGILNRILHRRRSRVTWKPEGMYRFLSLFQKEAADVGDFYASMINDFAMSDVGIIDQAKMKKFLGGQIRQSRLTMEKELEKYEKIIGHQAAAEIVDRYESMSDLQKPFYSVQVARFVARQAEEKARLATERADKIESSGRLGIAEKKDYERLKNKERERQRERLQQKRRKQSQRKKKRS